MSTEIEEYIKEEPIFKPTMVKALNYVALLLSLVLIAVIYIPSVIWEQEAAVRNEFQCRLPLLLCSAAQAFSVSLPVPRLPEPTPVDGWVHRPHREAPPHASRCGVGLCDPSEVARRTLREVVCPAAIK